MSSSAQERKSAGTFASAGKRFLKKLVYENYDEPTGDRRSGDRQKVVGEAVVSVTGPNGANMGETRAFIRDSSRSGCGLWSRVEMPVGSTVMVNVIGGDGRAGTQRLGRVRHCRGASGSGFAVGVQFDRESDALGQAG